MKDGHASIRSIATRLAERGLQVDSSSAGRGHEALTVDLGIAQVTVHVHFDLGAPKLGDETATVYYRVELFGRTTASGSFEAATDEAFEWIRGLFS